MFLSSQIWSCIYINCTKSNMVTIYYEFSWVKICKEYLSWNIIDKYFKNLRSLWSGKHNKSDKEDIYGWNRVGDVLFTSSNTVFIILQSFLVWSGVNYGFYPNYCKMHEFELHIFNHTFLTCFFYNFSLKTQSLPKLWCFHSPNENPLIHGCSRPDARYRSSDQSLERLKCVA